MAIIECTAEKVKHKNCLFREGDRWFGKLLVLSLVH